MADLSKRNIGLYWIYIKNTNTLREYVSKNVDLNEIMELFCRYSVQQQSKGIPFNISEKKIFWIPRIVPEQNGSKNILIKYLRFNEQYPITNAYTLLSEGDMDKNHGGEQKQHAAIFPIKSENRVLLLLEHRNAGINITNLRYHLNNYDGYLLDTNHHKTLSSRSLQIDIKPAVGTDFLEKINKMGLISEIDIVMDKKEVAEKMNITFSDPNLQENIRIVSKAKRSRKMDASTIYGDIKKIFDRNKEKPVIRNITVKGTDTKHNPVKIDYKEMELKRTMFVEYDDKGLVDTEKIFEKFTNLLNDKTFKAEISKCVLTSDEK
ncbi:hypothetical protein HNP92_001777 [Methanococcus maripaludis]|uniref:Uncharacterized protein n=1 Tax=Methanococcus maripaludis TaxID=39152 RepID=A0A7J9S722_METMI|nr:hypothetical protein [Methanococcus maripaludis]MBB6402455.1 hypothetical protein [Methanococcus maripaludis]